MIDPGKVTRPAELDVGKKYSPLPVKLDDVSPRGRLNTVDRSRHAASRFRCKSDMFYYIGG